ncbi:hypothetical protein E6C60_3991 [Paenibacillus algicola]|uniref:Uncharacterized protein n=1 Tax=Paenibacillus algicola TaxID=2565926 RepID=A0A4P8XPB5_9BACL|nr:hypothetical protein [Paenibacillus algicola]QCT04696.1 hypothetical protein E6C60_3991 [Paenibacillus algicola]
MKKQEDAVNWNNWNKHRWTAVVLSLIATGAGMMYIGTGWMIFWALLFIVFQGLAVVLFFFTLGFMGLLIAPAMLLIHLIGVGVAAMYFRRPKDGQEQLNKERRLAAPGLLLRGLLGVALFAGSLYGGYTVGMMPFTKTEREQAAASSAAEQYLQDKYQETFEVTEVEYSWSTGYYTMKAHPAGRPELYFSVSAKDREPLEFRDYYELVKP